MDRLPVVVLHLLVNCFIHFSSLRLSWLFICTIDLLLLIAVVAVPRLLLYRWKDFCLSKCSSAVFCDLEEEKVNWWREGRK